jgi:hypothetical protein
MLALAGGLAFALGAVQWIPTLELARRSGRTAMNPQALGFWSAHPLSLLDLLFPRLIADAPLSAAGREVLFDGREPFLVATCLCVVGWPLVALGLGRRGLARSFGAVASVVFVLLALGRFSPLQPLLARVPPFSLMRYPVKYLVAFALFWSLLAGLGLEEWRATGPARRLLRPALALVGLAAAAALLLALAQNDLARPIDVTTFILESADARLEFAATAARRATALLVVVGAASLLVLLRRREGDSPGWSSALLMALALAEAVRVGRSANLLGPAALVEHMPPVVEYLQAARRDERVWAKGYGRDFLAAQLSHGPAGWNVDERWMLGLIETLRPPVAARFGVYGSYDGDFTGLLAPSVSAMTGLVESHAASPLGLRLLQMGNVGRVVSLDPSPVFGLAEAAPPQTTVYKLKVHVSRVPEPLPRAYAVEGAVVSREPDAYLRLADPAFDPLREVVLPEGAATTARPGFRADARVVTRGMDRLSVAAELNRDGYVVLVEAYEPGWRATLDGRPAPVLRANVLFRAVPVPAGAHRLELRYRPGSALAGSVVSAAGLVACALLLRR